MQVKGKVTELSVTALVLLYATATPYFHWKLTLIALAASSYAISRAIYKNGRGLTHTGTRTTELYVVIIAMLYSAAFGYVNKEVPTYDVFTSLTISVILYNLVRGVTKKVVNNVQTYFRL